MSVASGPFISTSGLLFSYDMGNPGRSWEGAPTTNLTPNLGISSVLGAPTVTYVGIEDGWKKYSLNGTWTGGTYPYSVSIDSVSFTGGVTYTSGVFIKTSVPAKFATLFTGMNYVNEPMNNFGTSFSTPQSDGSFFVGRSGFQYTSTTPQPGYILSQPVVGQTFSSATDFIFIKDGQVQTGSFPTPFTSGTRSNTQALLDLTSTSIITTNNLTYNSDNTFNFAGGDATSTVTVPLSTTFNKLTGTIGMWVNPSGYSGSNGLFVNRDNNTPNATDWFWIGSWDSANVFYFRLGDGSTCCNNDLTISNWASFCPTNTWTYVTCSWLSGGESRIYTNGVLRASRAISSIPETNPSSTGRIGLGHESPGSWNGKIGTTQIYNRQLTEAEILQNFNALRGRYGV
jgi:hypothetical protein